MNQIIKINGFPVGVAIPSNSTKVEDGVEFTLCAINSNDFSMWIPSYILEYSPLQGNC